MKNRKPFFAEAHTEKRSFSTLSEAVDWVNRILADSGYTGIEAETNGEFVEFRAVKDGRSWDAAIIEDLSFDD